MPVVLSSQRCPDSNTIMDIYGDRAVTCKTASGVIHKHNSIVKCLVLKMNPSRQRPGDIFVPEFDSYGDAYLDVSVKKSSKGSLIGADIRYGGKMKKYPDLGCEQL